MIEQAPPESTTEERPFDWQEQIIESSYRATNLDWSRFLGRFRNPDRMNNELDRLERLEVGYAALQDWLAAPIIQDCFGDDRVARDALLQRLHRAAGENTADGESYRYYKEHLKNNKLRTNLFEKLVAGCWMIADGCRILTGIDPNHDWSALADAANSLENRAHSVAERRAGRPVSDVIDDLHELEIEANRLGEQLAAAIQS